MTRFQLVEEFLPTCQRLGRPNPKTGRNTHYQRHEVLQHENLELRLATDMSPFVSHRTRNGVDVSVRGHGVGEGGDRRASTAHIHMPREHPVVNVDKLVQVAYNDQHSRDGVQDTEDAYPDHELLQLVRLGTVMLHDGADATEGDEASEEEHEAEDEVDAQGDDDKVPQRLAVPDTNVTNAGQDVT